MASAPRSPAPSSTIPASSPKVSSEDIISQKTDLCISNAIVKTGIGFSSGVILSVLLFRRRAFPVWLGTGFGLGSGWTDCERSFNPVAIPGVRILPSPHHEAAPSSGRSSVMERLNAKTSDLIDVGKSKGSEALNVGKSKVNEAIDVGKSKSDEVVGKGKEKAKEAEEKASEKYGIHSIQEETIPPQDCTACRLVGFTTLSFLSAYSFKEAYQLGHFSRHQPHRLRGTVLVLFGIGSALGGVYRLVN